ncbi:nuclear pore complex protein Nup50 [Stegastes partitus]|uniref:Nuclear pore complex protein Nup50 n=1 Tax=Stegastes partitus TaxID=144197 RepID=A0A3B5ALY6_9TELE|nr:PREDICTED: nuclear pore complex protein Nup50 [Stegastes partitus]XP_008303237.1 PREDICTED: nuclear pore complex protein Nup50 [Stegastes partitus]XP_008303238.1 PREDICTED: nuclear pore complex protein Nup50 [Stegastes partitus]
MAKRIADKELTDRNWDQEEEGEEAGTFSVASEDVLKNRAIKKAKRRNTGSENEAGGAFKGFKGFSLAAASAAAAASGASTPTVFSGFGNGGGFKGLGGLTNGSTAPFGGFSSSTGPGVTFNGPSSMTPPGDISAKQTNGSAPGPAHKEYSRQLTALNCSVRDWITKHVNDNPLCDLNPIFRDYERHLSSIERQYGAGGSDGGSDGSEEKQRPASPPRPAPSSGSATPTAALFSFSKTPAEDPAREKSSSTTPVPAGITFNFGQKVDSSVLSSLGNKASTPSFSFSSSGASTQNSLFGSAASFSGSKPDDGQPAEENADEESEEPPKPEIKEVKEDDAFYSKKCKMFYKKESEFKEKGVGTLHLKQTTDGKTQMIIRADTNLGNILLNIMVHSSMPCSRVGKNNVMVVCVPNPPVDDQNPSSPVPLLIRVKTSEDADELHKTLEEKKG